MVVEVISPGTAHRDRGRKLDDYFQVPSITHYLIVRPDPAQVIHHRRESDGRSSRVVTEPTTRPKWS